LGVFDPVFATPQRAQFGANEGLGYLGFPKTLNHCRGLHPRVWPLSFFLGGGGVRSLTLRVRPLGFVFLFFRTLNPNPLNPRLSDCDPKKAEGKIQELVCRGFDLFAGSAMEAEDECEIEVL
jgi:hypothetical protein